MHGLPLTLFYLLVSSQAAGWLLEGQQGGGVTGVRGRWLDR